MLNINQTARERKLVSVRRTDPVVCLACGRRVARQSRQQRYCSQRCRQKAAHALKNGPRYPSSAHSTNPPKKTNKLNGLQRAKSRSSPRIVAPPEVIEAECFAPHSWMPHISSEGVLIETASLRPRLVVSP
jgi:hypothetical protein